MADTPLLELLLHQPFFAGMRPEWLRQVAACATLLNQPGRHFLMRAEEPATLCYLILEGRVALELPVDIQGPVLLDVLKPGDAVAWASLAPSYEWSYDVLCLEDCRLIAFDLAALRQLIESDTALGYDLMRRIAGVLAQRLHAARRQLLEFYI